MGKILLVEDDQFIREIYTETLKNEGFEIEVSLDGEDAYNKIKANSFDLILLDIVLPKIMGLELAKKILVENLTTKNSIVFTTNSDASQDLKDAVALGAGYLIKSNLTPQEFSEKIKGFMQKKTAGSPNTSTNSTS